MTILTPDSVSAPPPRSGPRREGLILAAAAVVAAILVLMGLWWWSRRDGGERQGDLTAPATTSAQESGTDNEGDEPAVDPEPDRTDDDDDLDPSDADPARSDCPDGTPTEVCRAVAFVEEVKGAPFQEFPTVSFVDFDTFDAFILENFRDGTGDLDVVGERLRSLGLIDPDTDLGAALETMYEIGVVGVYHTVTKELLVRGTQIDLLTQMVMVHELVHAWDDQRFGLYRPELQTFDDEQAVAFLNLVEGSAKLVEDLWRASLTEREQAELQALEMGLLSFDQARAIMALPRFVIEMQTAPYIVGAGFVREIFEAGGMEAVHDLFENPPTTTEQVMRPEAYRSGEAAVEVEAPPAGGPIRDEGVMGRLTFDRWLGPLAAEGWGGDVFVTWREGDRVCTAVRVIGDTERDTEEFLAAGLRWATDDADRTAERLGPVVHLEGCI